MSNQDVRWIQRLNHFQKAFSQLHEAVELAQRRALSRLEEQGLVKAFEYTYEMAWNTLKDYLEDQGETAIHGSRDAIRLSFRRGLIQDGETWMDMIKDRTLTTHTYNEETAHQIAQSIINRYHPEFARLIHSLQLLKERAI